MRGFIEVPNRKGANVLIALSAIAVVRPGVQAKQTMVIELLTPDGESNGSVVTTLSYEEIKALIEQAL